MGILAQHLLSRTSGCGTFWHLPAEAGEGELCVVYLALQHPLLAGPLASLALQCRPSRFTRGRHRKGSRGKEMQNNELLTNEVVSLLQLAISCSTTMHRLWEGDSPTTLLRTSAYVTWDQTNILLRLWLYCFVSAPSRVPQNRPSWKWQPGQPRSCTPDWDIAGDCQERLQNEALGPTQKPVWGHLLYGVWGEGKGMEWTPVVFS